MAFIYYSDPSVVDASGQRFVRSAVLIRPDWLMTSALGPSITDPSDGFPKKTLLARAGAIAIDDKFTLNEDEDEQEREIVQIVRPYNHSATQWWTTDISLIKTLLPFNITSAVDFKNLQSKPDSDYNQQAKSDYKQSCSILVYARKFDNVTESKTLMMLIVEMLPPSIENCGSHFEGSTMTCSADSLETKNSVYDMDYCHGNSGGPLICDNEVIGLQTYIGDDCKQPHLYQLIHAWDNFITCAIEDKCQEENCGHICEVNYKDPVDSDTSITLPVTYDTSSDIVNEPSPVELAPTVFSTIGELSTEEAEVTTPSATMAADEMLTPVIMSVAPESPSSDFVSTETSQETFQASETEEPWPKYKYEEQTWPKETETTASKGTETTASKEMEIARSKEAESNWSKETEQTWSKEMETTVPKETETTYSKETEQTWSKETEATWPTDKETTKEITWPKENLAKETKSPWLEHHVLKAWPKKFPSERNNDDETSERASHMEAIQEPRKGGLRSKGNKNTCNILIALVGFIVLICL